jgi:hypothetical protein
VESPSLADTEKANLGFRSVREMQGAALWGLKVQVLGGLLALLTRGRCPLMVKDGVVEGWMQSLVNGLARFFPVAEQFASVSGKQTGGCDVEAGGRATGSLLGCTNSTIKVVERLEELGVSASEALWKDVDKRLGAALGAFTSADSRPCQDQQSAEAAQVSSPENTVSAGDRFRGEAPGEKTAGMQEALTGAQAVQELGNLFRIVRDLCTEGALGTAAEMVQHCGESLVLAGHLLAGAVRHSEERGPLKGVATPSRRPDSDVAMQEVVGPYVDVLVRLMDLVSSSAHLEDCPPFRPLRSRAEEARERPIETQPGQRLRLAGASNTESGAPKLSPVSAEGGLNNHAGESEPEMSRKSVAVLTAFLLEALGGVPNGRDEGSGTLPWGVAVGQAPGGLSTGPLGSVTELVPLAVGWLVEGEGIGERGGSGGEQNGRNDVSKAAKIVSSVRVFCQVSWSVNMASQRREGFLWAVLGPWMDPIDGAALKLLQREENDRLQKEVLHLVEFAFGLGADSKAAEQDGPPSETEAQGTAVEAHSSALVNPSHTAAYTDVFLVHHVSAAARLLTSAAPEPIERPHIPTPAEALKFLEPFEPSQLASKPRVIGLGKLAPQGEPARKEEPRGSEKCLSQSELCTLHLRVITAIARGKAPGAIARLYQLGLMGRLVEQIGLEYESTLVAFPSPLSRAHSRLGSALLGDQATTSLDRGRGLEQSNTLLDILPSSYLGSAGEDARESVLPPGNGAAKSGTGTKSEETGGLSTEEIKMGFELAGAVEASISTRAVTEGGTSGRSVTPLVPRLRLGTLQALSTAVKPLSPGKLTAVKPISPGMLPAVKPIGLLSPSKNSATGSARLSFSDKENISHRSVVGENSDRSGGVRVAFSMPKLALSKLPANRGASNQKSPFQGGLSPGKSGGQMSAWSSRLYAKDPTRKHLLSPVSPIPSVPELPAESRSGKALSARFGSRSKEPSLNSRTARASVPERGAISTSKEVLSARRRAALLGASPRKDRWRDLNDEVDRQMGEEGPRISETSESDSDVSEMREEAFCSDSDHEEELRLPEVPLRHSDVISLGDDVSARRDNVIGGAIRTMSVESSCSHVWDDDGKESSWESRAMGSGRTVSQSGTAHEAADRIVGAQSEPTKQSEPFMARVEREALGLMQKESGGSVGASESGARGGEASESKSAGLIVAVRPVPRLRLPLAARKDQIHKEAHHVKAVNGWTGLTKLINENANLVSDGVSASSSLSGSERQNAPTVLGLEVNPKGLVGSLGKVPGLKLPTTDNHVSLRQQSENADTEQKSGRNGKAGRETERVAAHYQARRSSALMYSDQGLHVAVLELIFCMMTTAE